jgi:peptide-methionine (R)-S-oxide reductase
MTRRGFLMAGACASSVIFLSTQGFAMFGSKPSLDDKIFPMQLSDAEWKDRLTDLEYYVLREHGTERSGTSPLDQINDDGVYHCAGCDQELFNSAHKFDSGTGWPSFYQPIDGVDGTAIGERVDNTLWMKRTEVHCSNCGGHQGHVFPDGPEPTGLRYCINGVALNFKSV